MSNNGFRKRVGVYGGSFNPAHSGHLSVAEQALELLRLDEVWLVVSPQNPLKDSLDNFEMRFSSALSIANPPKIIATDIEKRLMVGQEKFYSFHFLQKLKSEFPEVNFILIIGADNLVIFHKWYNWQAICEQFKIAVFPRAGYNKEAIRSEAYEKYPDSFILVKAKEVNISSTELRELSSES